MKNKLIPPYFLIKDGIHGVGVFVTTDIKKGKVLFKMKGPIISHPTRTSVQVGRNRHIEDKIAGCVNHSCSPNTSVHKRTLYFVSARDIKSGEELSFDYNANEDLMATPFTCSCCNKTIGGRKMPAARKPRATRKRSTETA